MIKLKSYAKINLGLEITGKRTDGYHNLTTIFQTIDISDSIEIRENRTGKIKLNGDDDSVEWNQTNTIAKIFDVIYKTYNINAGFDIFVEKRIPPGSGLGGGSSNAAVILLFLNEYFKLKLKLDDLIKIGQKIGADVPFFLTGGTVLGEGIGEKITLMEDLDEKLIGIVIPKTKVSTPFIFSHFSLTSEPFRSKISTFLKSRNFSILENNLEKITFEFFPEIKEIKNKMLDFGCELVLMSGSGSAVYCIAEEGIISMLIKSIPDILVTKTINRESYLKNIGAWPSGKAPVFGAGIRRFESSRPRGIK